LTQQPAPPGRRAPLSTSHSDIGDDLVVGRIQRSRAHRRRRKIVVGVVVLAAAGVGLGVALSGGSGTSVPIAQCITTSGTNTYLLDPEQAANAATVRAAAARLGLPDHAVTVGLATALQESKLRNLTYGDRDSLGLFQQRPSQGWGTAAEVSQPTYASTAFFRALAKLPNWQTLTVADAAQRVQRSADGSAYAAWEPEARAFASALTGEVAAGVTCSGLAANPPAPASTVAADVSGALGAAALEPGVPVAAGWSAATYLVVNAQKDGIASVSFAGRTWTAAHGTWDTSGPSTDRVTFAMRVLKP
jgi:hypothetical protein